MKSERIRPDLDSLSPEELRALVIDYEARLHSLNELISHIRHELNNPLTGVIGQAQLLLRAELDDSARRRVSTIEQLSCRIRDIVARLRESNHP